MSTIVALIPARSGSTRIPGKNTKPLGGKPLIQWTIEAAQASGIFSDILVSSDIPIDCGARVLARTPAFAADDSPDIEWVREALITVYETAEAFAILRPTSPFRTAETIRRAWAMFQQRQPCHSLRAVEPVTEHPGKMWRITDDGMRMWPIVPERTPRAPWHSTPTQALPAVYRQNASLEIAWVRTVHDYDTIAGHIITPFLTHGWEGFDINTPEDWARAEAHVTEIQILASLP